MLPSRRSLLTLAAALPVWARIPWPESRPAGAWEPIPATPFPLAQVRLLDGPFAAAAAVNRRYLLGLDTERLAQQFRVTAGLSTSAEPYGGWERPECELRGHFVGHYLSATALVHAQTGDPECRRRNATLVAALAECQRAHGDGYLSAFPREYFDRLKAGTRVWAPFYTLHKILAGLVDSHQLAGNGAALAVAEGMARWVAGYVAPLDDAAMQKLLNVEHGGMKDTLLELAAITRNAETAALARRFRHHRMMDPLVAGRDELTDVHANTTIPKVLGEARDYSLGGDMAARVAAEQFWRMVALHRSYATGGSNADESWAGTPDNLAGTLRATTQETCTSYNLLKLTRTLFSWTGDVPYADFHERLLWNGILPTQHPADGEKLYYTPLGPGHWKLFGTPDHGFWCCHGSGVENFARAGDGIYFRTDDGLMVTQFLASELRWPERGLTLRQETRFPAGDRVALTLTLARPASFTLRLRIPAWAGPGRTVTVNGAPARGPYLPGQHLSIQREWRSGDRVEARFPMALEAVPLPGAPAQVAVRYGPLVLVGRMGTAGITAQNRRARPSARGTEPWDEAVSADRAPAPLPELVVPATDPARWLVPVPGAPLTFRTTGQATDYTLVPLYQVFDERYAAYWTLRTT